MTSGDLELGDMVTKKTCTIPGVCLTFVPKIEVDPTIGLGGVRGHTDTHTYIHTHRGLKRNI